MTSTLERPRTVTPPPRSARPASRGRHAKDHPLWFLIPALAVLVVFFAVPTVFNFVYAFTNWSSFKSSIDFIGTDNFVSLFSNGSLVNALTVTLIYAVLVAIFQNLFGLALALLLERDTRTNRALRVAFFVPVIMSALAVGYIFQAMLKPDGALNGILSAVTGQSIDIAWLGSTTWTIVVVALIHAWKWMGLSMLIYLAGLKTINDDILEAARLDGAGGWTTFRAIRFPLLAPAVTFNVATALLGSMARAGPPSCSTSSSSGRSARACSPRPRR